MGQRAAETFVKKQEQEGDVDTFGGELIRITAAIAFEQTVAFEFAQIVAKLVQPVTFGG